VIFIGLVLAVVLAAYSQYRIGLEGFPPSFEPRKAETWQSEASVFLAPSITKSIDGKVVSVLRFDDPARFTGLASIYSRLATSDDVRTRIESRGLPFGQFSADPAVEAPSGLRIPLPIISLVGSGTSPWAAKVTLTRGLTAFTSYMAEQQEAAGVPKSRRVELRVLNAPGPAVLVEPRKRTLPVVVFLSVMIASIALAFVLENTSRRRTLVGVAELNPTAEQKEAVDSVRRRF
jgi:hypothetical protein